MAEIGLIASVIQVAGAGLTLSNTLCQYADSVSSADKRIRDIAQDVKLTSSVIGELGDIFKQDETAALISENAVNTAEETVRECSNVFTEMEAALKKSKKNTLGRLMLPFREPKLELLRTNIDRLKSTLQLLMQVLTHAHQIAAQKPDKEVVAVQRQKIKVLIQTKKESTKRYEESLRNYGSRAMNNDDDLSAEISDEKNETSDRSIRTVSPIGTTITAKGLESCVGHIQKLLKGIEAVQRVLSANIDSTSSTEHEQGLIESYFQTRSALDSVILGSSLAAKADSGLGEVTLPKIEHLSSVSIGEERGERVRLKKTQTYSKGPEPDPKFDEEKKPFAEMINEEAALWGAVTVAGDLDMGTFTDFNVEPLPHRLQINSVSEKSYSGFKQQTALPPASQVFDPTEEEQYRARGAAEEELLESKKRSEEMSAQISVRTEEKPLAIKFKDAIGRKFSFPFELCKTWKTIEELINQAFLHVDVIGEHVRQGRYDLVGPEGEVILPQLWETVIEPGWEIKMHMWLIPEQPSQSLGPHSRPPQPPQPLDITSPLVVVTTPLANNKAKKANKAMHPLYMYGAGPRSRRPPSVLPQDARLTDNTAHLASAKQDQEDLVSQELYCDEDFYQSQNHYESENYYDNEAKEKREKLKAMRDEREKRHQDISPFIRNNISSAVTLAGEISESDQKIDTSTAFDITYEVPITDTKHTGDITTPPEPQTALPPTSLARFRSGPAPPPWPSKHPRPHRNPATSSATPTPRSPPPPPPSWTVPTSLTISNLPVTLTEDQLDDLLTDQKLCLPWIYEHQQPAALTTNLPSNPSTPPPGPGLGGTVVANLSTSEDAAVVSKALDGFEMPRSSGEQEETGERRRLRVAYKKPPTEAEMAALEKQRRGIYDDSMERLVERPRLHRPGEGAALSGAVPTSQQPSLASFLDSFPEPSVPHAVPVGQEAGTDPAIGLGDVGKEKEKQKQKQETEGEDASPLPPGNSRNPGTTRSRRISVNNHSETFHWVTSSALNGFKDINVMRKVRKAAMDDPLRESPKHSTRPHVNGVYEQRSGDRLHSVGSGISDGQEPSLTSNEWAPRVINGGRSRRLSPQSDLTQSTTHVEDEDPPSDSLAVRPPNSPQLGMENMISIPESILAQTQVVVPPGPGPGLDRSLSPSPSLRGSVPAIHQPQPPLSSPVSSPASRCASDGDDTGFEISDDASLEDVSSKTLKVRMIQRQTLKPTRARIRAGVGAGGFKTAEGATARSGVEWTVKDRGRARARTEWEIARPAAIGEEKRARAKSEEGWTRKDSERERERERELAMARAEEERARVEERQMTRARAEEEMAAQEMTRKVRREWMRKDSERESNSDKDDDVDELLHEWTTLYAV